MSENAPATAEDQEETLRQEYGRYVATEFITIDGTPSFNAGDPVPVGHVKRGLVDKSQVKDNGPVRPARKQES
jgi:hypothetical protein